MVGKPPLLGTDHLNFWEGGGGWVIFGETVFFFLLPENHDIFFDRLKDRIFFFSDKVKAGVVFLITI